MNMRNMSLLKNTLDITKQGFYIVNGKCVKLKLSQDEMKCAIVLLPDQVTSLGNQMIYNSSQVIGKCNYGVENADSLAVARKQYIDCSSSFMNPEKILVLNFANPVHPGGDVRWGAKAQEEDLCRKSSLLLSLESNDASLYYKYHRARHTRMASDAVILSPKVEIIRDEWGNLLDDTVVIGVLTCAAPMVPWWKRRKGNAVYEEILYKRIMGMLHVAVQFGYENLVLGAWGCGAYGNDAVVVSDMFYRALTDLNGNGRREKGLFRRVDFAVWDNTKSQYNYKAFEKNFAHFN